MTDEGEILSVVVADENEGRGRDLKNRFTLPLLRHASSVITASYKPN